MGRLIFGMMQSLDGYIAGRSGGPQPNGLFSSQAAAELPPPGPILSRHFNDLVRGSDSFLYGRRIYEVMRYWDEDQPDWDEIFRPSLAFEVEVGCITFFDVRWS